MSGGKLMSSVSFCLSKTFGTFWAKEFNKNVFIGFDKKLPLKVSFERFYSPKSCVIVDYLAAIEIQLKLFLIIPIRIISQKITLVSLICYDNSQ